MFGSAMPTSVSGDPSGFREQVLDLFGGVVKPGSVLAGGEDPAEHEALLVQVEHGDDHFGTKADLGRQMESSGSRGRSRARAQEVLSVDTPWTQK